MGDENKKFHSVYLNKESCIGCTDCLKRCPTEAIRVRNKKAVIIKEKCVDCGLCIKICKNLAKQAATDSLASLKKYKINVAIPAPALYAQFKAMYNTNKILTALKKIGFDEVFEVSKGAELISDETNKFYKNNTEFPKPIISSACPAVTKVIQTRFPSLIPNILPIISPKETTARLAKQYYIDRGYSSKDIGVFFISPCTAKITTCRHPETIEHSSVDGSIAIRDIYKELRKKIKETDDYEILRISTNRGMKWAAPGGEGEYSGIDNYVAVDGMDQVLKILEMIENGLFKNIAFVECLACTGGCLGGPLTVENPFVAKNRIIKVANYNKISDQKRKIEFNTEKIDVRWEKPLQSKENFLKLDDDISVALKKMELAQDIYNKLPQIDCGACGSPTCKALAEDIVAGYANLEDCIFMLKAQVRSLAEQMVKLAGKIPQSIEEKQE